MRRRTVITGLGVVSPIGIGKERYWESLIKGQSGISQINSFDTSMSKCHVAAQIVNWDISGVIDKKKQRMMDLSTQYALIASIEALKDAKIKISPNEKNERISLCCGIACGGIKYAFEQYERFRKQGLKSLSVFCALAEFPSSTIGYLSIELGIRGESILISTGDVSSTDAIGYAHYLITSDKADIVIAGGTEAPITPIIFYSLSGLNVLADSNPKGWSVPRPFDRYRNGFVLGEGAAIVIMEEYKHAKRRGAYIYGEVLGYSTNHHYSSSLTYNENYDGLSQAIKKVLEKCYIKPESIEYISAYGTGDILLDKAEIKAIKEVFGEMTYSIPISSIKGAIGYSLGASGAFQTVTNALILKNDILPPTINHQYPDVDCVLDYIPHIARKKEVKIILQNNMGFFGKNSTLLMGKCNI